MRRLAFFLLFLPAAARAEAPKPLGQDEAFRFLQAELRAIGKAVGNEVALKRAHAEHEKKLKTLEGRPVEWRMRVARVKAAGEDRADVVVRWELPPPPKFVSRMLRLSVLAGGATPQGGTFGTVRVPADDMAASLRTGQEVVVRGTVRRVRVLIYATYCFELSGCTLTPAPPVKK